MTQNSTVTSGTFAATGCANFPTRRTRENTETSFSSYQDG